MVVRMVNLSKKETLSFYIDRYVQMTVYDASLLHTKRVDDGLFGIFTVPTNCKRSIFRPLH